MLLVRILASLLVEPERVVWRERCWSEDSFDACSSFEWIELIAMEWAVAVCERERRKMVR